MENVTISNELYKIIPLNRLPPQQFFVFENDLFQVKGIDDYIKVFNFGPIKQNMSLEYKCTKIFDGYILVMPVKVEIILTLDIDACNGIFKR